MRIFALARGLVVVGLLLGTAPYVGADADVACVRFDRPTVLTTKGVPSAALARLPQDAPTANVTWPLPTGPLLILAVQGEDETADALAGLWGLLPLGGDLGGGYAVAAWHDGVRPLAMVLAADAAALVAARAELHAAPGRRPASTGVPARADDGGLLLRRGVRRVRPRYRERALDPRMGLDEAVLAAAAGHANRLWLDVDVHDDAAIRAVLPDLAAYGIEPVLAATVTSWDAARKAATRLAGARDATGIDRFALRSRHEIMLPGSDAVRDARRVRTVLTHLRATGPVTVLDVVPTRTHEHCLREWPYLSEVSGLEDHYRLAWDVGDADLPPGLERARALTRAVGVPVLHLERWAEPWARPDAPPIIPTRTRGRDPALGRALAGIVVVAGRGAELILADAWLPAAADTPEWATVLLPLLPAFDGNIADFLRASGNRLAAEARRTHGVVPWMAPLAGWLAEQARTVPPDALAVPRIPAGAHVDGRLDDRAWAFAARRDLPMVLPDGTPTTARLLAFADGSDLYVALVGPPNTFLWILGGLDGHPLESDIHVSSPPDPDTDRVCLETRIRGEGLGGDAYPTRCVRIMVSVPTTPWPRIQLVLVP